MRRFIISCISLGLLLVPAIPVNAQERKPSRETVEGWDRYIELTERRIQSELNSPAAFVRSDFNLLKTKKLYIQQLSTKDEKGKEIDIEGGTIHHWLGAIYVPGKDLESLLNWVRDYDRHQDYFKEVEESALRRRDGERYEVFMRLMRSKLGVTARFNTDHTVTYSRPGTGRAASKSVATRIRQLDRNGKEIPPGQDSGYLWRLNSYWRFSEREGGVIVECESVGLSRPLGSWLSVLDFFAFGRIKRIAESVAREALTDTLTSLREGVSGGPKKSE